MRLESLNKPNKQLVISCFFLIGLVIMIYGITNFNIRDKHSKITEATIISSSCIPSLAPTPRTKTGGMCNISVVYDVSGKSYKTQIFKNDDYDIGDKINVYYNPDDPSDISVDISDNTNKSIYYIMGGLTIFSLTTIYSVFFQKR